MHIKHCARNAGMETSSHSKKKIRTKTRIVIINIYAYRYKYILNIYMVR